VGDRKVAGFRFELGEEHRLIEKVAKLLAERRMLVLVDGFEHLVGFFEDKRFERIDRLLAIPGTAARGAQARDNFDEPNELDGGRMKVRHGTRRFPPRLHNQRSRWFNSSSLGCKQDRRPETR